ncbi:MAG: hypothetical protein ABIP48_31095 [Planctomycetota bacterium]
MLRYRIAPSPTGRYVVIASSTSSAPVADTFATRAEAQDTADWLNRMDETERQRETGEICVH